MMKDIPVEHFRELTELTAKLTEIQVKQVPHTSIENFASSCLSELMVAYLNAQYDAKQRLPFEVKVIDDEG